MGLLKNKKCKGCGADLSDEISAVYVGKEDGVDYFAHAACFERLITKRATDGSRHCKTCGAQLPRHYIKCPLLPRR